MTPAGEPTPLREAWSDADVDTAALWSGSGARWLSDPRLGVPHRLVTRFAGVVEFLDRRGADLVDLAGSGGLGLLAERAASMGLPPSGIRSCGGASRLLRCGDGWVVVTLARPSDVDLVAAWLETDPVPEAEAWHIVERELSGRRAGAVVERAALLGLPCSSVGESTSADSVVATRLGDALPRPLDGLVVMNVASLWAGPLCADILGRLGARVITIESSRRPDGGRAAGRFFRSLHSGSESVALDLRAPDDQERLRQLLACADVVLEGSRPRALEQMGVDARTIAATGPAVWVSITGHGREGRAADRVGFGDDGAVAGGLVGWVDGSPRFVADAVADPLTGTTAAATVVQLLADGGRWLVDIALARVARSMVGEWRPIDNPIVAERPRPRRGRHDPMPLGRDTAAVLAEFGID